MRDLQIENDNGETITRNWRVANINFCIRRANHVIIKEKDNDMTVGGRERAAHCEPHCDT